MTWTRVWLVLLLWFAALSVASATPAEVLPLLSTTIESNDLEIVDLDGDIPSPSDFLGYPLGSRFTQHHQVLAYLEHLGSLSKRVTVWNYGTTYEGRPLVLLAVSSEKNLARLDEIRSNQLRLASQLDLPEEAVEKLVERAPSIAWLAYGVHGNESSSTEVSMAVTYTLAAAGGKWADLLKEVVVLIDPLVNPDGRERYVNTFLQRSGQAANPSPRAIEHREPWPGGRTNHYMIDLNRDWTWATQVETQARIAAYRQWEPHAYVDFHEMSSDSTYFFPPAAEPILPLIDKDILRWLEVFGKANADAFDAQGWLYYNRENFDLFYPGYGDTYPALRAAVGMTYEVAGSTRGALVVETASGQELSLGDRIARHFTTSLATIEVAAKHREELVRGFAAIRRQPTLDPISSFLIEPGHGEYAAFTDLLDLHGIEFGSLSHPTRLEARRFESQDRQDHLFPPGTIVVSTDQPLGNLVRALLAKETPLSATFLEQQERRRARKRAPQFYDVTAWSLPLAFSLNTWIVEGRALPAGDLTPTYPQRAGLEGEGGVGVLVPPQGLEGYRFAAQLQHQEIRYRLVLSKITSGERIFPAGSLFIPAASNLPTTQLWIAETLLEHRLKAYRVHSTATTEGVSLGSDEVVAIQPPRIALASGARMSPGSHGALWHLLDRLVEAPYSRIDIGRLSSEDLRHFDVLVLPDSSRYGSSLTKTATKELTRWLEAGGFLIAIGGAIDWLQDEELSEIKDWSPEVAHQNKQKDEKDKRKGTDERKTPSNDQSFDSVSTPGAAMASRLSDQHPLAAGSPSPPAVLALGDRILVPFGDPRKDVLTAVPNSPVLAGFAWPEAEERLAGSLLVGIEKRKAGRVMTFTYDPAFRLFWRATMPLLLNGLLHGPSLQEAGFLE